MRIIYTAISKKLFYFRMQISKFVFENDCIPLNPYMLFEYFLFDTVERNKIREANNILVQKVDELWVFGEVSNGVLVEIKLAKKNEKQIRYFSVINSQEIKEISREEVIFEQGIGNVPRGEL